MLHFIVSLFLGPLPYYGLCEAITTLTIQSCMNLLQACLMLSLESDYPPSYQLALDMLKVCFSIIKTGVQRSVAYHNNFHKSDRGACCTF